MTPRPRRERSSPPRASLLAAFPQLLGEALAHYRRAMTRDPSSDPVVVIEVLDRPANDFAEAMAQVDAEERRGTPIALGVQSRAWVTRRLRPSSRRAADTVSQGGSSPGLPMTLVIVSAAGIEVLDLPCPDPSPGE